MRSSRERKYLSISDASNSDIGGTGDDSTLSSTPLGGSGSGGFAGFLPSLWMRLRRAFTGWRSALDAGPDELASRGGTLRTVKCSSVRVYGERVWLEWLSVESWEMVLLSEGRRMIFGSCSGRWWWAWSWSNELEEKVSRLEEAVESRRGRVMRTLDSSSGGGGVGTEWVMSLDREGCVCKLEGLPGRRNGE